MYRTQRLRYQLTPAVMASAPSVVAGPIAVEPVPPKKFNFEPERGPRPRDGYVGLQNHSDHDVVFFKEVAVKMLKK